MDPFLARTMIETLSKGINPVSGLALGPRDSCANEEIQEALIEVLEHCTIESTEQYACRIREEKKILRAEKKERNVCCYPRGGEPWTEAEERQLIQMHRCGENIYMIANTLKRTPGAICSRLKSLQCRPIKRSHKNRK